MVDIVGVVDKDQDQLADHSIAFCSIYFIFYNFFQIFSILSKLLRHFSFPPDFLFQIYFFIMIIGTMYLDH